MFGLQEMIRKSEKAIHSVLRRETSSSKWGFEMINAIHSQKYKYVTNNASLSFDSL